MPKKKPGRPPKQAKAAPAKKGSEQAKVNSSHKGKKILQWEDATLDWVQDEYEKDKALPKDQRRSYGWFATKTGIGKSTIWARCTGKVKGRGKQSGGKNKSKVLPPAAEKALAKRAGKGHLYSLLAFYFNNIWIIMNLKGLISLSWTCRNQCFSRKSDRNERPERFSKLPTFNVSLQKDWPCKGFP
jgi:hypothetical protein